MPFFSIKNVHDNVTSQGGRRGRSSSGGHGECFSRRGLFRTVGTYATTNLESEFVVATNENDNSAEVTDDIAELNFLVAVGLTLLESLVSRTSFRVDFGRTRS